MRKLLTGLALLGMLGVAAADNDGWEKNSAYNKLFNPKTVVTVTGKVTSINREDRPMKGMEPGFSAVVHTKQGEDLNVQVGPAWFTSYYRQKWNVQQGDEVEVTGSRITLNGKPVIMAMRGRKGNLAMTCRNKTGKPLWDLEVEDF